MNRLQLKLAYLMNRGLKEKTEKVFEGIEKGRTKALYNWFDDNWTSLELLKGKLLLCLQEEGSSIEDISSVLIAHKRLFPDFSELFICTKEAKVMASSYVKFNHRELHGEYIKEFSKNEKVMYGPYIDEDTLEIGECQSDFFDEVTLMFIEPLHINSEQYYICGRIPNDVMSDILQDEDSHIYKESGDNYLFMVKSNREVEPGVAISRSRFEDNVFTLGDNLKEGIKTNGFGEVKIKKHTEFEIIFNNPKLGRLHEGVEKTIQNGSNLEAWPGYPEYRHILVGGKGIIINPPNSSDTWGLLCEGDIDEIYSHRTLNEKLFYRTGLVSLLLIGVLGYFAMNGVVNPWIAGGLLWLALFMLNMFNVNRLIVSPVKGINDFLTKIAEGEGDLTKRIDRSANDETGELGRWFNKFINSQLHIVRRILSASVITNDSVDTLKNVTESLSDNMNDVDHMVGSNISLISSYSNELIDLQEKFTEISNSIIEVSEIIGSTQTQMDDINTKAVLSQVEAEKSSTVMSEIVEDVSNTHSGITELEKQSNRVKEVITVIDGISNQTKLLALNASIEAARAGEQGKGFSVVAEEISKLANLTSQSTKEIEEIILTMGKEVDDNKNRVGMIDHKIKEGNDQVECSISSFKDIQGEIGTITESIDNITEQVKMSSVEIEKIKEFVDASIKDFKQSSKESEEESQKVLKELASQVEEMKEVGDSLNYTSTHLHDIVTEFRI